MKSDDPFFSRVARMVGWTMNQSHVYPDYIPARMVVNRNGMLTGKHHFGGVNHN